jgi:uncharacterized protein
MDLQIDLPRESTQFLLNASKTFPVLLLTGARQVGKTTLLKQLSDQENLSSEAEPRKYVTLDDPLALRLAKDDPALFLQRYSPPVIIDEIQYAPSLFPYIKMAVDQARRPGLFWLTGSQPFHLMQGVSESLAGRIAIVRVQGFSSLEKRGIGNQPRLPFLPTSTVLNNWECHANTSMSNVHDFFETIWRGSFPAMNVASSMNRDLYFGSYVQTYVQRDVRDLAKINDEVAFVKFVGATAARTGQMLNVSDLAKDVNISPTTATAWLSILQASGLIYLLAPWHQNVTKRLVKTPKLYFLDTGLAAYLTQWSSAKTLEAGAMAGAFFETWVIAECLKSYWHQGIEAPFYYFRNKDQREIDLLIAQDGKLYPIECKKSASPSKYDSNAFSTLAKLTDVGEGAIVCLIENNLPLAVNLTAVSALRW